MLKSYQEQVTIYCVFGLTVSCLSLLLWPLNAKCPYIFFYIIIFIFLYWDPLYNTRRRHHVYKFWWNDPVFIFRRSFLHLKHGKINICRVVQKLHIIKPKWPVGHILISARLCIAIQVDGLSRGTTMCNKLITTILFLFSVEWTPGYSSMVLQW